MSKQILIVDDEPYIQMLIEHTLQGLTEQGVTIHKADNGQDALNFIQTKQPELVFLDVMMPQMNGFAVCQTIKNDLKMENIYIAIVSGRIQEFDQQYGLKVGANQYITKPFDPQKILEIALDVLGLESADVG